MTLSIDLSEVNVSGNRLAFVGDFAVPPNTNPVVLDKWLQGVLAATENVPLVVNLETASGIDARTSGLVSDPKVITPILKRLNTCMVSIANNHTGDAGDQALYDMVQAVASQVAAGVTGWERTPSCRVRLISGQTVSVISAAWMATGNLSRRIRRFWNADALLRLVETEKSDCDFLVAFVHWGYEFEKHPLPAQRKWARELVDAGADLVVGAHPHVAQGFEEYKNKLIAYSLGNFLLPRTGFTSYHPPDTGRGLYLQVEFLPAGHMRYEFIGLTGTDLCVPVERFAPAPVLSELSTPLQTTLEEYRRWHNARRTKWYLPAFDGTAMDFFRRIGWHLVNKGVMLTGRLGLRSFVKSIVARSG